MCDPQTHRKRVKHFELPSHAHELTFSCYRRFALLENNLFKQLLSRAIDNATAKQCFRLFAFVYMPEHVHLIVLPMSDEASISSLLYAIKRPISYRVKRWMQENNDPWLGRLVIRERHNKTSFRFWQEGPGYDRNIDEPDTLWKMIDYLHANPIRRGLCNRPDQWPWSSWHHYHGDTSAVEGLPIVHGLPAGWH